jgi:hypothetical protein
VHEISNCSPFEISVDDGGWQPLALHIVPGAPGNCAGNDYLMPHVEVWLLLEPEATTEMTWDGRALVLYEGEANCFSDPGVYGVLQPVSPGTYRVGVPYYAAEEMPCPQEGSLAECGPGPMSTTLPVPLPVCDAPLEALAEFEMPEEGDVVVQVDLD